MPSQAREELETDPDRTALRVLELRAYAQAKAQFESARKQEDLPTGPVADLVLAVQGELMRARRTQRGE